MPTNKKSSILDSKLLWMIFSLLISILLWMYVTTLNGDEGTTTYYGIDVQFSGEENLRNSKGYIITDVSSNSVNVTMKGSRSVLASFDEDDLKAVIDVSNVSRVGSAEKAVTINFPSHVDQSKISIESRSPNLISYYVDREITKPVELRGKFSGSVAEGYLREDFIFEPATVRISGPAAELDDVAYAQVTVERQDLDRTISYEAAYQLIDFDGNIVESNTIEYESDTVNVTLPVKATKQVPLTVDLVYGGGATSEHVTIECEPKYVTLAGDPAVLDTLNKISVDTIDVSAFDPVITKTCSIIIPNEVENITGETEVTVTVSVKGLSTVKRTANNLVYTGLPEGFKATIVNKSMNVVLRGPDASVKAVANNNIRVVADLSGVTTVGAIEVPVEILVDGFSDVGAVGEYTAYVTIER